MRPRKFESPEMTMPVVFAGVPNGTLPRITGPAMRPAPSVAVAVNVSPEVAVNVVVKLPSLLVIEMEIDADVAVFRS